MENMIKVYDYYKNMIYYLPEEHTHKIMLNPYLTKEEQLSKLNKVMDDMGIAIINNKFVMRGAE